MSDAVRVTDEISIPMGDLEITAIRSRGAGGQNVNKLATAIHLRFDIAACSALPADLRDRLRSLDDSRITADGIVVIKAREHRTQEHNRREAIRRLVELIRAAAEEQAPRIPTRIPKRTKARRLENKRRRGELKRSRREPPAD